MLLSASDLMKTFPVMCEDNSTLWELIRFNKITTNMSMSSVLLILGLDLLHCRFI